MATQTKAVHVLLGVHVDTVTAKDAKTYGTSATNAIVKRAVALFALLTLRSEPPTKAELAKQLGVTPSAVSIGLTVGAYLYALAQGGITVTETMARMVYRVANHKRFGSAVTMEAGFADIAGKTGQAVLDAFTAEAALIDTGEVSKRAELADAKRTRRAASTTDSSAPARAGAVAVSFKDNQSAVNASLKALAHVTKGGGPVDAEAVKSLAAWVTELTALVPAPGKRARAPRKVAAPAAAAA